MSDNPQARVQGKTGILDMDSQRRIHRQLTLARLNADGPAKMAAIGIGSTKAIVRTIPLSGTGPRFAAIGSPGLAGVGP
jgi:hypothetical protein